MAVRSHTKKAKKKIISMKRPAEGVGGPWIPKGLLHTNDVMEKIIGAYKKKNVSEKENGLMLHNAVMKGINIEEADMLKSELNINDEKMAEILGTSHSSLLRWRKGHKDLDSVASDRLIRVARILELATGVFEDKQKALSWLKRDQFGLGGKVPIELLMSEAGAREVENLLQRIEHGVLA